MECEKLMNFYPQILSENQKKKIGQGGERGDCGLRISECGLAGEEEADREIGVPGKGRVLSEGDAGWSAGVEADETSALPVKSGGRMRTSFLITLASVAPG
jgi:hypothetical protein